MRSACALLLVIAVACSAAAAELAADDLRAINRLTYGVDDASVEVYGTLGRAGLWAQQLQFAGDAALPRQARDAIAAMMISRIAARDLVWGYEEEARGLKDMPEGETRKDKHKALNERYRFVAEEAQQRHMIRALYSRNQLQEQLTWFWFNHFNVFQGKDKVRLLVADYEERAIRPHVLGRFRDLLLATMMHPAMLLYLDNAQNAAGRINENYARELLELHTLGVDGGYTQQDVQELARILTGVGVSLDPKPVRLPPRLRGYYVAQGMFVFNPQRHDFGEKTLLHHRITGRGFDEVAEVVDILCSQPATARFISRKLAVYFMGDDPPPNIVQRMQDAFLASNGNIGHVLRSMFDSSEFWREDYLGKKFKDPVQYVFSALRAAYDGRLITNYRPAQNWLRALGEPLYGHQTPDGYGMRQKDWASPEQMARRFEVSRKISNAGGRLFAAPDSEGSESPEVDSPQPGLEPARLLSRWQPLLSLQTVQALAQVKDAREWTALFLSAPEFMYR